MVHSGIIKSCRAVTISRSPQNTLLSNELNIDSALHMDFNFYLLLNLSTESSKYYARIQTAVARGLGLPTRRLAGHHSDAASKHSLCYFSLFSE